MVPVSEAHKLGQQCAYLRNRKKTTTPPASLKETLVPVAGMCLFCCCFCCWCSFCRETGHHSAVLFVSQCCNLATVLFNFPFLSLFSVQHNGACMAAAVTPRVGHRNAVFFVSQCCNLSTMLFYFPFLSFPYSFCGTMVLAWQHNIGILCCYTATMLRFVQHTCMHGTTMTI